MTAQEHFVDDDDLAEHNADFDGGEDLHDLDSLEAAMHAIGDDEHPDRDEDEETDGDHDFEEGDEVLVALPDGEELPLGELKRGYLRHQDYIDKTDEIARHGEAVEELYDTYMHRNHSLQNAFHNLSGFVAGLLPAEPDINLARTDPARYQEAKALREHAVMEIQGLLQAKHEFDESAHMANSEDFARLRAGEDGALLQLMPALREPGRRAAFDAANRKTALEFGFSDGEISSTIDHRILQLVHYARIGKIAETNRKNAARRINGKPRHGGPSQPAAAKRSKSSEAMKRLAASGSMDDALGIDFD